MSMMNSVVWAGGHSSTECSGALVPHIPTTLAIWLYWSDPMSYGIVSVHAWRYSTTKKRAKVTAIGQRGKPPCTYQNCWSVQCSRGCSAREPHVVCTAGLYTAYVWQALLICVLSVLAARCSVCVVCTHVHTSTTPCWILSFLIKDGERKERLPPSCMVRAPQGCQRHTPIPSHKTRRTFSWTDCLLTAVLQS